MSEKERVDSYLNTVNRLEPDIRPCDRDATLTSIAISLKRIANILEDLPDSIYTAIYNSTRK